MFLVSCWIYARKHYHTFEGKMESIQPGSSRVAGACAYSAFALYRSGCLPCEMTKIKKNVIIFAGILLFGTNSNFLLIIGATLKFKDTVLQLEGSKM